MRIISVLPLLLTMMSFISLTNSEPIVRNLLGATDNDEAIAIALHQEEMNRAHAHQAHRTQAQMYGGAAKPSPKQSDAELARQIHKRELDGAARRSRNAAAQRRRQQEAITANIGDLRQRLRAIFEDEHADNLFGDLQKAIEKLKASAHAGNGERIDDLEQRLLTIKANYVKGKDLDFETIDDKHMKLKQDTRDEIARHLEENIEELRASAQAGKNGDKIEDFKRRLQAIKANYFKTKGKGTVAHFEATYREQIKLEQDIGEFKRQL